MMQLIIAALAACLPALGVFAVTLWWVGFEGNEAAGVVAMLGLICAGIAWLGSFAILATFLLVL